MPSGCEAFGPEDPRPTMLGVLEDVTVKHAIGDLGGGVPKKREDMPTLKSETVWVQKASTDYSILTAKQFLR